MNKIDIRVDQDGGEHPAWRCARCGEKIRRVILKDFKFKYAGTGDLQIFQFCPCGWYSHGEDGPAFLDGEPLTCANIKAHEALYLNEQFFALGGG